MAGGPLGYFDPAIVSTGNHDPISDPTGHFDVDLLTPTVAAAAGAVFGGYYYQRRRWDDDG